MLPKITIVTPNYNQGRFLERTIRSILSQNYDNLEYIIIDGGSTDDSVAIIKKYESHLAYWVSEKDKGLYPAINKGFDHATGDIMGWLNSDDILYPNALHTIADIFNRNTQVRWLTGMPITINEQDEIVGCRTLHPWSRTRLLSGHYQWIQQESTYWRRDLWLECGGKLSESYSLAGDLELWVRFSRFAQLHAVKAGLAGFRFRQANQKSIDGRTQYLAQAHEIIAAALKTETLGKRIKIKLVAYLLRFIRLQISFLSRMMGLGPVWELQRVSQQFEPKKKYLSI
jgi:glycosyltransferase involved in cell wall biosynthesis